MRFARSAGYLDWNTQPDPFRRFAGAPSIPLPLDKSDRGPALDELYNLQLDKFSGAPLSAESLGRFFELSLAITAWKVYQTSRWALRANPSSGNLHPTEGYCIIPGLAGISPLPGVYHYRSDEHAIERRCEFTNDVFDILIPGHSGNAFLAGLSSVHWREAWKYGERAFRYCQHDVGHALGSLRFAAAALGWRLRVLPHVNDMQISALLGLERDADFEDAEREAPDLLLLVETSPAPKESLTTIPDPAAVLCIRDSHWQGRANTLSSGHVEWDAIEIADAAARRHSTGRASAEPYSPAAPVPLKSAAPAASARVIRDRRSAQAYDGKTNISLDQFLRILDHTIPRAAAPFDSIYTIMPEGPATHFAIFVHRIDGLERGLYFFARDAAELPALRSAMRPAFEWRRVATPEHLHLYLLKSGDMTGFGPAVSCNQDIAGDGVFSLGMIARFEPRIRAAGAHYYKYLHWEAGLAGQVLYLECEAAGIRGTGIGCFYDDEMHGLLGIRGHDWHTIYHFAAGGPVADTRIQTEPPYSRNQ